VAGRERQARSVPNGFGFGLARAVLDLASVRAALVLGGVHPERSEVVKRRGDNRIWFYGEAVTSGKKDGGEGPRRMIGGAKMVGRKNQLKFLNFRALWMSLCMISGKIVQNHKMIFGGLNVSNR